MIENKNYYKSNNSNPIIPSLALFKYKPYKINWCHQGYQIKKYFIIVNNTEDNLIEDVIIYKSCHPNAWGGEEGNLNIEDPPKYSKFCLPPVVKGAKLISNKLFKKYQNGEIKLKEKNVFSDDWFRRNVLMIWQLNDTHHDPLRKHFKTIPHLPDFRR